MIWTIIRNSVKQEELLRSIEVASFFGLDSEIRSSWDNIIT